MQTGGAASKYDDFWVGQLPLIRPQVVLAAAGGPAMVSVPDLIGSDDGDPIRVTLTVADTAHEVNVRADFAAVLNFS
jgi:hypothetical protein